MGAAVPQVVTESSASGAQVIDGSLKFDRSKSQYLKRTPGSASNKKTWTWSGWFKNSFPLTGTQSFFAAGSNGFTFRISATGAIEAYEYSGGFVFHYVTTALFRDPSAWYHIVLAVNTDDSTASDRIKIYVNGSRITSFATSTSPSSGATAQVNNTVQHEIGNSSTNTYLSGYLSQVNFIDGLALGPESFGYTDGLTNTWRPKKFIAEPEVVQTIQPTYVNSSAVLDPTNAFDGSSGTEATYSGVNSWISFSVTDASNLSVPFTIRNDSSGTAQSVAMYTDSGGSSAASGSWGSTGNNTLSPAISTTVNDTYTFPSTGTYYLRHTVGSDSNIFVYKIGGSITTGGFGTNGFYLPMDGNSPIGEDKSPKGNNWTPVNFGGSVALDNPIVSGARPILNTGTGGTVARPGVFGSEVGAYYAVTVASVGGGNRYHFDGVDRPNPTLIRGATYTFDQSDSSNSTHPLRFATAADAAGSSQYTDGVVTSGTPGSAGAYTKITVPHNAPDTLHYYCTNHGGMGSSTSQITDETKADPYAWKNTLALPLVGNANDVSNRINSGSTTKAVANTGVEFLSESSNFYNGSAKIFDTDKLNVTESNSDFTFGTSTDFTIECWTLITSGHYYGRIIEIGTVNNNAFVVDGNGPGGHTSFRLRYDYTGSTAYSSYGIVLNKWHHVAAVRNSGTLTFYIDGIASGTVDLSSSNLPGGNAQIGNYLGSNLDYDGYIQDLRLYKGVAKYTSNFVPTSTSPDILPDTPSGVSGDSKLTKITDGAVSFDGSGDSLSILDNADFDFGTGDFTVELFTYNDLAQASNPVLIGATGGWYLQFKTGGTIVEFYTGSTSIQATGLGLEGGWHHIAVTKASNVVKIFIDGILKSTTSNSDTTNLASTLYIGNLNGSSLHYLGFISNVRVIKGTALYTSNFTPPTAPLTNVTNTKLLCCQSNTLAGSAAVSPNLGGVNDGTVWSDGADLALANFDGIQAIFDGSLTTRGGDTNTAYLTYVNNVSISASTGIRIYWNGVGSGQRYIRINGTTELDDGSAQLIPGWSSVSSFSGTINKIEIKTANTGSFAISAIEIDGTILIDPVTANGDATSTTFNPFNTDIDTVRGQETGYPTWNPLTKSTSTLSNGNLTITTSGGSGYPIELVNTFTPAGRGQWYWEFTLSALSGSNYTLLGMIPSDSPYIQGNSNNFTNSGGEVKGFSVYVGYDGSVGAYSGAATAGSATATIGVGGVVGWAYDAENGTLKCFINGVPQGTQFTNIRTDVGWLFGVTDYDNSATASYTINFGQNPFKYAPPAGFQPLNAANLRPETVIVRPDHYVDVDTYTGTTPNPLERSNFSFAPDFLWFKSRAGSRDHVLFDTVRGRAQGLKSNGTDAQASSGATQDLVSFDNNGFTVGEIFRWSSTNRDESLVVWAWKAGGSKNTFNVDDVGYASAAAAGLDGGTINPTGASVGTKQGFSILKYQGNGTAGANISHGLLEAPKLMIHKSLDQSRNWYTITTALDGSADYLYLNTQGAAQNSSVTVPTSSLMYFTSSAESNNNGENYVAYLWHDVPGLQKFGSFEANQNADGPFVELGFRPAIVWIKNIDNYDPPYDWVIYDNARSTINPNDKFLSANLANVENSGSGGSETTRYVDFLSNGFKVRTASTAINLNAHTQLYCAWAEAPTFNLFGAQSNAR
jgi:hypothetical protein